ncbi:MAG: amylo-alpha-1,6-glucosidase [Candidatus Rokubacteria bacterium]|nr:amylo-alpha-1,6-glucosidase [Candidatus Rokubacteria bacterium]
MARVTPRSSRETRAARPEQITAREARRKAAILTQSDPAKVRETRESVVLKEASVFLVTTEAGDVPPGDAHAFGLYFHDCRYLDGWTLSVNGTEPIALSGASRRSFETTHHATNADLPGVRGGRPVARNTIALERRRTIRGDALHETLTVRNFGRSRAGLDLGMRFDARFDDMFVVKGFVDGPRGRRRPVRIVGDARIEFVYDGVDGLARTTAISFAPPPERLERSHAVFHLELAPGERREIGVTIAVIEGRATDADRRGADPATTRDALTHWHRRAEDIWLRRTAGGLASNPLFDRVLRRALLDLRLLRSRLDGLDYYAAGVPWFATLFGRDAAPVALQTLPYGSATARQTLALLARHQATAIDHYRDAASGKILHEFRTGELARVDEIPQSPAYYGSVDATMLFLILVAQYVAWSGDLDFARELRPNVDAALGWMDGLADSDGDGYVDYAGRFGDGLVNQGWKDSGNAIVNADGSLAEPPIALAEVQAYAFRARREMAALFRRLGDATAARQQDERAAALRARFEGDYWDDDLDCYVLARQRGGRAAAVVTSNTGQVLWTGIGGEARARHVAERLLAPDMFSGWGIRTLSSQAVAYNPMSYHLGSVWPHDNAIIVAGFRRYGLDDQALRVFDAIFDAASHFRAFRLPELYCGYERRESEDRPVRYPVACSPQAWAAGALPHALASLLGLRADGARRRLTIVRPRLPEWLAWLTPEHVRVGQATVDLRFARSGSGEVDVTWRVREGALDVERTEIAPASDVVALTAGDEGGSMP